MPTLNKKINLVMFNMSSYSEWQSGIQNRNWHIFKNLSLNENIDRILLIDYLPHNLKRGLKNYFKDILSGSKKGIINRRLWCKAYQLNDKVTVYSSLMPLFSAKKFYQQLLKLLAKIGFEEYLVWSYYPLEVGYLDVLKPKLFIFDAVDNWAEHPSYSKSRQHLLNNYKRLAEECDIIFTVADQLKNLFDKPEKVHWLPNGVDLKHYQKKFSIINRDIGSLPKPIIGYVGTIQDRLDLDLLIYLAKSNPQKSFALVGPVWYKKIKEKLSAYPNVYFLGRKKYEEVPMYIQQFDVGIIPHKIDQFIKSTNPMKIYEYLACGKPIISTEGAGVEMFEDFISATNDFNQFNKYLNQALVEDSAKLRQERLEAVSDHSWLKRVERMLEIISQKL